MAEKSLHNFQFPNSLKWNTKGVQNRRRTPTTPSPSPVFNSTRLEYVPERAHAPLTDCLLVERSTKNMVSIGTVDVEVVEKKKTAKKEGKHKDVMTSEGDKNDAVSKCYELVQGNDKEENVTDGIDEETVKSWNLRSRTSNGLKASASAEKVKAKLASKTSNAKCSGSGEKLNFTVPPAALTQTEIEEDFYALGHKMPRRPKKRPKPVQNVMDCLFPGSNLTNISEERYYISANSMKKHW